MASSAQARRRVSTQVAHRRAGPGGRGIVQRLTGLAGKRKARDVLYKPWRKIIARSYRPQRRDGVVAQLEREGGRGGEGGQRVFRVTFVGLRSEPGHRLPAAADQGSRHNRQPGISPASAERRRRRREGWTADGGGSAEESKASTQGRRGISVAGVAGVAVVAVVAAGAAVAGASPALCNDSLRRYFVCAEEVQRGP